MSDQDDVPLGQLGCHEAQHHIRAGADLIGMLAARARMSPHGPLGDASPNFGRGESLVVPVIPLRQCIPCPLVRKAGKVAGALGAQPWAGQDHGIAEAECPNAVAGRGGLDLAERGEWDFGAAGVFTAAGPFGFAVT